MNLVERLALVVTGDASGGVAAFKSVGAASKDAAQQMSIADRAGGMLKGNLGPAALAGFGIAADAAIFKFGQHLVDTFASATASVRAFQRVSGASAEDSSRLVSVFNVLGIDTDKVGQAVFRLAHNLDKNEESLAKYGVTVARNKTGGIDLTNTFLNVADAVAKVGPGFEADAIAAAAFGARASKDLLPVLLRGRDGLKELFDEAARHHQIFSQSDLESGRQFTLATKELQEAFKGLEIQAGKTLIPIATGFTNLAEKGASGLGVIGDAYDRLNRANREIVSHIPLLSSTLPKAHKDIAKAAADAADETDKEAKATKNLETSSVALIHAREAGGDAQKSLTKAVREEGDAQRDLNDLLKKGAVDATTVADAKRKQQDATVSVAKAEQSEADAATAVAKAVADQAAAQAALDQVRQGTPAEDLRKAELDVADAQRAQSEAVLGLDDAQANYSATLHDNTKKSSDLEKAGLELDAANEQVERSAMGVTDAQARLTQLQQAGKEGSQDLAAAEQQLKDKSDAVGQAKRQQSDAHDAVTKAQQDEKQALDELHTAEAGDPDFAKKVVEARQKVADAQDNVEHATRGVRDAAVSLNEAELAQAGNLDTLAAAAGNVRDQFQSIIDQNPALTAALAPFIAAATDSPLSKNAVLSRFDTGVAAPTTINHNYFVKPAPNAVADAVAVYAGRNGGKP